MNIHNLDLRSLRKPLEEALSAYASDTGLKFQDFPDLNLTPTKSNSARTIIPVTYSDVSVGELCVIAFVKGDGTGDSKTYQLKNLIIPSEFYHSEKSERVIPRAKTGIFCECCLPLFSITPQERAVMFAASLEELSLSGNKVTPLFKIGQTDEDYSKSILGEMSCNPQMYLTIGESPEGKRVGDPHSIYYKRSTEDALQVVGFLGVTDPENPILNISHKWILPKKYN